MLSIFLLVGLCAAQSRVNTLHTFTPSYENNLVPNWAIGAGAYANTSYIRLTPARQSRTGYAWNQVKVSTMTDWEVVFEFQVTGKTIGGDGFAFWFVEQPELLGAVYGSQDYWIGLGIFFDTFNNDGRGDSPLITAQFNDGTQKYDQGSDGESSALGKCSFAFRNLNDASFARIRYLNSVLSVEIALNKQNNQPVYTDCMRVENVELGLDKYFGLTAHTGDVADNHDILSFVTTDLSPPNPDLERSRLRFKERLAREQALPNHQTLSQSDYQHTVLTLLNQIQEASNMMELSQTALQNMLSSTTASLSIVSNSASPGAGSLTAGAITQVTGELERQLGEIVTALEEQARTLVSLGSANRGVSPSAAAAQNSGPDTVQALGNIQNHLSSSFQGSLLNAFKTTVESELKTILESIRSISTEQRTVTTQIPNLDSSSSCGSSILVYIILTILLIAIIFLIFTTFKNHQKYSKIF